MKKDPLIIAVDFDGTIVENDFPEIGKELPGAIRTLKDLQAVGHKIIIWTCRCEPYLSPMTAWFKEKGFTPDAVNSNLGNVSGFAMPKIFYDVLFDDRSFPPFRSWNWVRAEFLSGL
jgi:hypothetical protein